MPDGLGGESAEPLTDHDVIEVTTRLDRRIPRHLTRCGRLRKAEPGEDEVQPDEPLLAELVASSRSRARPRSTS